MALFPKRPKPICVHNNTLRHISKSSMLTPGNPCGNGRNTIRITHAVTNFEANVSNLLVEYFSSLTSQLFLLLRSLIKRRFLNSPGGCQIRDAELWVLHHFPKHPIQTSKKLMGIKAAHTSNIFLKTASKATKPLAFSQYFR